MVREMWPAMGLALLASLVAAGCGLNDGLELDDDVEVRLQELDSFCTVQVEGYGAVDVEEDYLPSVIACENGNAPMEALKAQAVAARTYAAFIVAAERRPLIPTTRDQVYDCSHATPEARHYQAVRETAGQMLTHRGRLAAAFYVAGAIPSTSSCRPAAGDRDPTGTEKWVTYNQGRTGSDVRGTRLGSLSNPANRGAKSQNGAACLANAGWGYEQILRSYYGDDIGIEVPPNSQCAAGEGTPGGGDVCSQLSAAPSGASGGAGAGEPSCTDNSQAVEVLPRSAWNARPSRYNTPTHTPNRISVHHTVTANNVSDAAAAVRQVQQMHFNRRFHDVGYHFLIGWDGRIFQGTPENKVGAHVKNQNTGNLGIALLGSFHLSTPPSEAQQQSLARLIRHLSDKYDIEINRTNIKGHGERMATACPGGQVLSRFDAILEMARADATCSGGDSATPGEGEEDTEGQDVASYRYVRVSGVDLEPVNSESPLDGYEVDAIYVERQDGSVVNAARVACSPGVQNPQAALGAPDNTSCDNRAQTAAGVVPGADLIVEMQEPVRRGDILYITQAAYPVALSECSPNGTAKVSVSNDGSIWKVLDNAAQGNQRWTLGTEHFVYDEDDEAEGPGGGMEFISPRAGHWYRREMTLKVVASDPSIVKVRYEAEHDNFHLGTSEDRSSNFEIGYTYQFLGERVIFAIGLDADGQEVARREVRVTITDFDGTIPEDKRALPYYPDAEINSASAERIASEGGKCLSPPAAARCSNGSGGYSTGHCWRFVKRALERAGVNYNALQGAGPCSSYEFQLAARGFRCNADANPDVLRQIGLQKIDVPTTEAPRGAIISWEKGCAGYHARYGHIEISQGNGVACSDYCGRIRANAPTCASVYVPIN
ncbi:N-acetylmuramoyl-L-alanine amidase [Lujinxingia litoralis]|nr:N-acetylmuramoyl-L-alanine amidase [Lujinxingia litoralis]